MGSHQNDSVSKHDQSHLDIHHKIAHQKELKQHIVSFAMMIFLTMLSFIAVASEAISTRFAILFILVLAGIQAAFQLYIWMHLSHKGHQYPTWGIFFGIGVAATCVAAGAAMIW
ncbi:cytochrome C oxidase subunit IV family protein [Pseudalkalibacillus caeni]|uniref:Cytochrome B6 n=1 Tax=Exobacillus caeni TaxID=2574798 RepID=A0A5R9FAU5_9BACL|nr:cytochrome C oxidase subunit IV family protein [Pseudalkalibacillus caeni]TLS37664.1 cytochrome B6 [Pseudalkalibacillus caeni]